MNTEFGAAQWLNGHFLAPPSYKTTTIDAVSGTACPLDPSQGLCSVHEIRNVPFHRYPYHQQSVMPSYTNTEQNVFKKTQFDKKYNAKKEYLIDIITKNYSQNQTVIDPGNLSLNGYLLQYLKNLTPLGHKNSTAMIYLNRYSDISYKFGSMKLMEITPQDITAYVNEKNLA